MTVRRSRTRRASTGKRIELSRRDLEIFRALTLYRYLSSTYLHAFAGGLSEKRFKERLGDLFHEGYIDRPKVQWEQVNSRYRPAIYEGKAATSEAIRQAGLEAGVRTYLSKGAHRQFPHSLLICELLASIELATMRIANTRFIGWSEILARSPQDTRTSPTPFRIPVSPGRYLVPDALFGLEYTSGAEKAFRFFALEADRGTMPISRSNERQTSYLGKLAAYRSIIESRAFKTHLGIPNLLVLTVTTGPKRLAEMLTKLGGEHRLFLFKSVKPKQLVLPAQGLLSEAWQRAGLALLDISKP
jgi:hypothetical protein